VTSAATAQRLGQHWHTEAQFSTAGRYSCTSCDFLKQLLSYYQILWI